MATSQGLVDLLLHHASSPALVASFFCPSAAFEGDLLYTIPGNDPHRITVEDLFAVTMLDVSVSPLGVRRLLNDPPTRERVTALLREVPAEVDIWDGIDHLRHGGPAERLWQLLQKEGDRIGPTTASKILARKRPRLVPIEDSVVKAIIQASAHDHWMVFCEYLQSTNRRDRLAELRPEHVEQTVPLLRVLDVLLWMWGSKARVTKKVRTDLGLPVDGWPGLRDAAPS